MKQDTVKERVRRKSIRPYCVRRSTHAGRTPKKGLIINHDQPLIYHLKINPN